MAPANPLNTALPPATPASSHTRLIEVVDALVMRSGAEPWGVRELAAQLDESRSTVNRILLALVERGFALEVGAGKYSLGPRVNVLTNALSEASVLLRSSALDELADETGLTALISICSPDSGGYFVAACCEAKASLTFRPELGTLYPMTFGDIGRNFAAFIDRQQPANESVDHHGDAAKVFSGAGVFAESEFPDPVCVVTRRLGNGLLIAVSVHSVNHQPCVEDGPINAAVLKVCDEIASGVDERCQHVARSQPGVLAEDTKSTVARLERLLLLACTSPDGVDNTAGLDVHLLCNEVTAKRLIQSGLQTGLVSCTHSVLYPGPKIFQWAAKIGWRRNIADLARTIVQNLVQETGETIGLLSYDAAHQRAEFVEVIQGWRPIQYQLAVHSEVPLYAGAAGKAVLAFCDPGVLNAIELKPLTEATITDRAELASELSSICDRGWATGTGERVLGAFGLAVPFFVDGKIRGSISATIPQYRKDDRDLPRLTQLMREATLKIERLLSVGVAADLGVAAPFKKI